MGINVLKHVKKYIFYLQLKVGYPRVGGTSSERRQYNHAER